MGSKIRSLRVSHLGAFLFALVALQESKRSSACIEQEKIGLIKLKAAFNFPNGSSLPSWDGSDCCSWERVTCDNTSTRVTELVLGRAREYELPPWSLSASIFQPFEELEVLDLEYNSLTAFTGELRLKKLRRISFEGNYLKNLPRVEGSELEVLDVSLNDFAGDSFSTIRRMTSLKALSISGNRLSNNSIFQGMCQLLSLEELNVDRNEFAGSIPPCLDNLTSLYALDLRDNYFTGSIPSSLFTSLESLRYISLSGNDFEGSFALAEMNNNSRLEVFDLVSNYHRLNITTENPLYAPLSQLKIFRLSDCMLNEPNIGAVPSFLRDQHDLRLLELSGNGMTGDFPSWLLENNTKLEILKLENNALSGSFWSNSSISKNTDMWWIDVSLNYIYGELPVSIGSFFPNLAFINMSRNLMRGGIPSSLGDMMSLSSLDLSSNNFMGELPQLLLNGCRNLQILKLSNNNLQGQVLPTRSNLTSLYSLSLANNQFTGEISPGLRNSPGLHILDISNNFLSGAVPSWIGDLTRLKYLVLSDNSLEGSLPSSFCKLNLKLMDLSYNELGPVIIPSCANVSILTHLCLKNNHLAGPFPQFLSRASSIVTLDLRDNELVGAVPPWVGSLPNLRALLLSGNNFGGLIPKQLCRVTNISIMDLSNNSLSGAIPSCFSGLAFGNLRVLGTFSTPETTTESASMRYEFNSSVPFFVDAYVERAYVDDLLVELEFMSKSRLETYKGNILEYMSGLDVSCNKLDGSIPREIGFLNHLLILNLSNNYLMGQIPSTLSELKQIESLDLSHNRLSGEIPPQLTELSFLAIFSVAYNNLSGRMPERKNQFGTFDERSYEGNFFLCGPPLDECNSTVQSPPITAPSRPDHEEDDHSFRDAFTWSFTGSYAVACLGTVAFLFLNSNHSTLLFNFFYRHIPSFIYGREHLSTEF